MAQINFKGNPISTVGDLPTVASSAPDFTLTKSDLSEIGLKDLKGKKLILSIFPSLDTPTCSTSVVKFNQEASKLDNTIILCISADLPFAHARFCGDKNIDNIVTLSSFRHSEFGESYGLTINDEPLKGLLARAVIVINEAGEIVYSELVDELSEEPNYQNAFEALG